MKLVLTSLALALATSTASPAAPAAVPSGVAAPTGAMTAAAAIARPSPERLELARRFLALAMPEDESIGSMREMSLRAAAWSGGEPLSAAERASAARFTDRVFTLAAPIIHLHMLSILEVSALVYAREFSAEELQQMIAFAATPAGKHYVARANLLDLDDNLMAQHQLLNEALLPVFDRVRKEICAEHTAQRIAAGDTKAKCPLASEPDTATG